VMVVNTPPGTPENVFNLAMELVSLLGAKPLVMDTAEADGVFSAMHILPQLAAAALLGATVDKPGWQEARKLAGRPYASVTASVAYNDDVYSLGESALNNRENVVRLLNTYIASLISLRDEIEANQREAILERLEGAVRGRVRWLDERIEADWLKGERQEIDAPSFGERVGQMLFGGLMTNATRPKQK
jgi:prephenate dehydrogenase